MWWMSTMRSALMLHVMLDRRAPIHLLGLLGIAFFKHGLNRTYSRIVPASCCLEYWLRRVDSNHDSGIQSPASCQLNDIAIENWSRVVESNHACSLFRGECYHHTHRG